MIIFKPICKPYSKDNIIIDRIVAMDKSGRININNCSNPEDKPLFLVHYECVHADPKSLILHYDWFLINEDRMWYPIGMLPEALWDLKHKGIDCFTECVELADSKDLLCPNPKKINQAVKVWYQDPILSELYELDI